MPEKTCDTCYWSLDTYDCMRKDSYWLCGEEKELWKPYTNGDAIRNMGDEELGKAVFRMVGKTKNWTENQMAEWIESPATGEGGILA